MKQYLPSDNDLTRRRACRRQGEAASTQTHAVPHHRSSGQGVAHRSDPAVGCQLLETGTCRCREPDPQKDIIVIGKGRGWNRRHRRITEEDRVVSLRDSDSDFPNGNGRPEGRAVLVPEVRFGSTDVLDEAEFEKAGTIVVLTVDRNAALMIQNTGRIDREGGYRLRDEKEQKKGKAKGSCDRIHGVRMIHSLDG